MGLETYLLAVTFKEPTPISEFRLLLAKYGAKPIDTSSLTDFELRDQRGLTEIHIDSGNTEQVHNFFLRFSILSPHTVIDQAFELLEKLAKIKALRVFDTHLKMKEIPIDPTDFKRNSDNVGRRKTIIENRTGLIIASGKATTDFIHEYNLEKIYKVG